MNTQQILEVLVSSGLLITLITVGVQGLNLLGAYFKTKTEELAARTQNATLERYINIASDSIRTAVMQLAQETADSLKAKAADGKLTLEEQTELKKDAEYRAMQIMGTEALAGLNLVYGDAQAWISAKIDEFSREAKVKKPG